MLSDFHLHCEFSDDSDTPMEEQIQRAIECGVSEMCFTDHVDYGVKPDWTCELEEKFRAAGERVFTNVDYRGYFNKLLKMKNLYRDRITIREGLECGVQTCTLPEFNGLMDQYWERLDFVLLSIHQIDNIELWTGDYMRTRTQEEYNKGYYNELLSVIRNYDRYDVLAHVDLISRYDSKGVYPFSDIKGILTDIFKTVIEAGKGIEINTSSWHYGLSDTTPSREILGLYRSLGGEIITMGSDAHRPEYVADHMDDAKEILKELGFSKFYTYEKHKPIAHSL